MNALRTIMIVIIVFIAHAYFQMYNYYDIIANTMYINRH